MDRIPAEALDRIVSGANLMPGTLRDQLGSEPTLLVFLRFFGCTFCRETVADIRAASGASATYPPVIFFSQGSQTESRAFMRRYWPEARVVSDPDLVLYEAFGVRRGGPLKMFGPGVFAAKRRATAKGHENGEASGDIFRMPGIFLSQGDEILWQHAFRHAADHPDFAEVPERLEQGLSERAAAPA